MDVNDASTIQDIPIARRRAVSFLIRGWNKAWFGKGTVSALAGAIRIGSERTWACKQMLKRFEQLDYVLNCSCVIP